MTKLRKIFTVSVMAITVLSMSVVVAPQADAASAGDLIKTDAYSSVYYLGDDGKRYGFPNEATYFSWYSDWSGVVTVPQDELEGYRVAGMITMRPGTKLVKIQSDPRVYAVEPGGALRWIGSEAAALALYGEGWNTMIVDVPDSFITNYTINGQAYGNASDSDIEATELDGTAYPAGTLVQWEGSSDIYYIDENGAARKIADEAAFAANRFNMDNVVTATSDIAMPAAGTDIIGAEEGLIDTTAGSSTAGTQPDVATGVTVALASDTPAAVTTLSDSTNGDGSQAFIPVTKLNFTASSDGDAKVTTLKFKRGGVPSADTDFAEFYLYEGDTLLAEYNSISEGVLTFTKGTGLFTVPAGTTKSVTLVVNLDDDVSSSRAYNFAVLSADSVATNGAAVSGSFPLTGNTMTTAEVSDLGKFTVDHSTSSSDPDPGDTDHSLWKFTAEATDQDIDVEMMKFTFIGTIDVTDLANLYLEVGGVQIGDTVAELASDKTVTFDMSANPYRITKGNTKTVSLKGDIVGGTDRTYQAYFYEKEDIKVKDVEYGVYVTPNQEDTWTRISDSSSATIQAGSLTVSKNTDSPSGNVALGSTNVEIGKFDFKAVGEDIKVDTIYLYADTSNAQGSGLYQAKLYVDGSQIGTAANLTDASASTISIGNSFIIPAGETKTLVVKSDIKASSSAAMIANETIAFQLSDGSTKAAGYTKQSSGGTGTVGSVSGNTLTVKSGTLTAAENTSFGDRSSSQPSGVIGATDVKLASFTLTAGAGEGVSITQISLIDYNAATLMGNNFQNLKLKHNGAQIGNTKANLNTSSVGNYDFSLNPAVELEAGEQYVVDIYGDIKSSATQTGMNMYGVKFASVTATGETTSNDASYNPDDFELQTMYISSVGNLNISDDADTTLSQQMVMGATDVEMAKFKLEASAAEDLEVSQLVISDSVSSGATGTLKNIRIYDGDTLLAGPVQLDTTNASSTYVHAVFTNVDLTIPASGSKTITVVADISTYEQGGSAASTHAFGMLVDNGITSTETVTVKGASSGTVLTTADNTIDYYSTSDTAADVDQTCETMQIYRALITVSWASDTPSGSQTGTAAQRVAKVNVTNSANAGSYTATVRYMNFAISSTGISLSADRQLKIYKDSISTGNLLVTTSYIGSLTENLGNTNITNGTGDANFPTTEISAGSTKTFFVTLDTTDAGSNDSISIYVDSDDVAWRDGAVSSDITSVNTLPLEPKTFTY